MSPAVGSSKPASIRSVVVLPQPEGPSSERNSAGHDLERHVVDRHDVREPLRDVGQFDGSFFPFQQAHPLWRTVRV